MKTNPPVKQPTKNNKSWLIKKQALDVAENLKLDRVKYQSTAINFLERILLEKEVNQKVAISWLIKKRAFCNIDANKVFQYALKCLHKNNHFMLSSILKAVKTQSPLREDLGLFVTESGETLGHLAAKQDKTNIIKSLGEINPEYLRAKTDNGDTIPHIASRFLSQKSLELMIEKYPGLFWVRNHQGLKPSDLEGGPLINSKIKDNEIQKAWDKDNVTYQRSLRTLQLAVSNPRRTKAPAQKEKFQVDSPST
jgi:hypothetical protein